MPKDKIKKILLAGIIFLAIGFSITAYSNYLQEQLWANAPSNLNVNAQFIDQVNNDRSIGLWGIPFLLVGIILIVLGLLSLL